MRFINQHSFTLTALVLILFLSLISLRGGLRMNQLIGIGALILGLVLVFLLINPGASTLTETEDIIAQINTDGPVLLEFQSPY